VVETTPRNAKSERTEFLSPRRRRALLGFAEGLARQRRIEREAPSRLCASRQDSGLCITSGDFSRRQLLGSNFGYLTILE
jgi:hypothetical protein